MPKYDNKTEGELMLLEGMLNRTADGLIEASEARGQAQLVASDDLPIDMGGLSPELVAEKTGIQFGEPINELFVAVTLPEGWSKRATDHSMHSELVDDKDRVRAGIFYKAAFYDRKADMYFTRFYLVKTDYSDEEKRTITVTGGGEVIKTFGVIDWPGYESDNWRIASDKQEKLEAEARAWLDETYAEHSDPFAYWG